jgi:hypothetical protein
MLNREDERTKKALNVLELLWRNIDMPYSVIGSKHLYLITFILFLLGCSTISPHENFKEALYESIGQSIDNVPSYSWPHEKDLVSSKLLPNGNIEKEYKYLRSCRYIFEINPKTRTIVGARFEGKETDCVINP